MSRPTPLVLIITVRDGSALLRAGGAARHDDVRRLAEYVIVPATWSRAGRGWVVAAADLPNVRAGAEFAHWVVKDVA